MEELVQRIYELIYNMGFDYDRFSLSGRETYDELCTLIEQLKERI